MATVTVFRQVKRPPPENYRDKRNRLAGLAILLEEGCQAHVHAGSGKLDCLIGLAVAP